jgi:hypothetical protein
MDGRVKPKDGEEVILRDCCPDKASGSVAQEETLTERILRVLDRHRADVRAVLSRFR